MYRALLIASREEVNSMDFYSRDLCLSIRSDGWRCCASHLSPASSQLGVEKALGAGKLQPFHGSSAPGGFVLGHEALSLSPFPAACPGSQLWVVLGPSSSTSGLSLNPAGETEARPQLTPRSFPSFPRGRGAQEASGMGSQGCKCAANSSCYWP